MTTQDTTMHNVMCGPGGPVWEPVVPLALSLQLPPHTASGTPPGAKVIFHQSGFIFVNNLIKKSYLYFLLILSVLFLKLSISVNFLFYYMSIFYFTWLLWIIMMEITYTHTRFSCQYFPLWLWLCRETQIMKILSNILPVPSSLYFYVFLNL